MLGRLPVPSLRLSAVTLCLVMGLTAAPLAEAAEQGFQLHGKPVVPRASQGAWASQFIDPGAMVFHDGRFHMFFAAVESWPDPLAIGYASSEDGFNWVKERDDPILTIDDTDLPFRAVASNSVIITDEGQWVLYFSLIDPQKFFVGAIGRATAPSPNGPWKIDAAPVLEAGPEGAWDGLFVGNASVTRSAEGYQMYYTGTGSFTSGAFTEEHQNIGLATSADGIIWTKHDDPATTGALYGASDPVFSISESEDRWDSWSLTDTNVQKTESGWAMVYRGTSFNGPPGLGVAVSEDGITWRRAAETPFLSQKELHATLNFVSYLRHGGKDHVYIESGSTQYTHILLATRSFLF